MIKLENKLYSSTEVANILGVSLRSVYRYLEEDKLVAEVKTATGRHRFTRQNIIDFLYPKGVPEEAKEKIISEDKKETITPSTEEEAEPKEVEKKVEVKKIAPEKEDSDQEEKSVDWLSKFRDAAKKFEEGTETITEGVKDAGITGLATEAPAEEAEHMFYYRSRLGGLKDIAQNIDKTSRNSGLDYAFTMNSGLSLYKPINPFSTLHTYVRTKDRDFFERILTLTPSNESNAQLCLILSDEDKIYKEADELHGLKVVGKKRLLEDISELDEKLLKEAGDVLSS